ncbi:hypothetical protein EXIGLDRAFT_696163 [Exidia glandulosa HHB12029]|uniref:Uncharacterized protein n=1 Tax=Exidia glandulosa HHB12029 TaxID=1314781 RepID=A0A165FJ96_EXIGL|nr:hypothetical protein EXIGLDRAFT_696163 [Exidia glandulosa HHB12029]
MPAMRKGAAGVRFVFKPLRDLLTSSRKRFASERIEDKASWVVASTRHFPSLKNSQNSTMRRSAPAGAHIEPGRDPPGDSAGWIHGPTLQESPSALHRPLRSTTPSADSTNSQDATTPKKSFGSRIRGLGSNILSRVSPRSSKVRTVDRDRSASPKARQPQFEPQNAFARCRGCLGAPAQSRAHLSPQGYIPLPGTRAHAYLAHQQSLHASFDSFDSDMHHLPIPESPTTQLRANRVQQLGHTDYQLQDMDEDAEVDQALSVASGDASDKEAVPSTPRRNTHASSAPHSRANASPSLPTPQNRSIRSPVLPEAAVRATGAATARNSGRGSGTVQGTPTHRNTLWNADMIAPFAPEKLHFAEHPGESLEDMSHFGRVSMPTNRAQRGTQFPNGSGTSSATHAQQGTLNAHQLPSQRAPVAACGQTEVQSTPAPTGRNSVASIHSHFSYSAPMVSEAAAHPPDTALEGQ